MRHWQVVHLSALLRSAVTGFSFALRMDIGRKRDVPVWGGGDGPAFNAWHAEQTGVNSVTTTVLVILRVRHAGHGDHRLPSARRQWRPGVCQW
jgi:hypothetical protein